jgi:formiminotetrahydrofolate cyclodeaminase
MAAMAMPHATEVEQASRKQATQTALDAAVAIPLDVMRAADRCWDALLEMAAHGNSASRSDLEVGARLLAAGVFGASRNVLINLESLADTERRATIAAESAALTARAERMSAEVLATISSR